MAIKEWAKSAFKSLLKFIASALVVYCCVVLFDDNYNSTGMLGKLHNCLTLTDENELP